MWCPLPTSVTLCDDVVEEKCQFVKCHVCFTDGKDNHYEYRNLPGLHPAKEKWENCNLITSSANFNAQSCATSSDFYILAEEYFLKKRSFWPRSEWEGQHSKMEILVAATSWVGENLEKVDNIYTHREIFFYKGLFDKKKNGIFPRCYPVATGLNCAGCRP